MLYFTNTTGIYNVALGPYALLQIQQDTITLL
jgi:hypothetical protein